MYEEFPIPKEIRDKDPAYLEWVRTLPSVLSGKSGCEAHHTIGHNLGGMAVKSSDYMAFPLTPEEHRYLHDYGWKRWENEHDTQWRFVAETMLRAKREGLWK